jgi:hypothetical protein
VWVYRLFAVNKSAVDSPVEAERVIAVVRLEFFLVTWDGAFWFLVVSVAVELSALRRV